jgi:predicted transposase/invertase (TIGR01784 family)
MSRYINPFTDFGFKKIFGEESSKDLLMAFLNALKLVEYEIVDLTFRKTEQLGNSIIDRKAVFDLYCTDEKGNRFIVELQKVEQENFKDRTIYYSSFAIQEQAERGNEWNYKLSGVYCVSILDFTFPHDNNKDKYIHNVVLKENETNTVFYDKLKYVYLEIPKFNKSEHELDSEIDKWCYFFKYLNKIDTIPNTLKNELFIKAFNIAEMSKFTKEQTYEYESSLKYYRDFKNSLDTSFNKGLFEGKLEGKLEGKIEIAKSMKNEKLEFNLISKLTGLTLDEIEGL